VPEIDFRPLAPQDLPAIATWLGREHVARWWQEDADLDAVAERYRPGLVGTDPTDRFVVVVDGRDVGMIQSYRTDDHPDWHATIASSGLVLPASAGIDYFIGERDLIGRGVGTEMVSAFTALVFARYPEVACIVVTPQAANAASCRVLEKAGYERRWSGLLDSDDPADAGVAALYVRERS
jgi:aminoglycoside 6'-N-acetyltransferase